MTDSPISLIDCVWCGKGEYHHPSCPKAANKDDPLTIRVAEAIMACDITGHEYSDRDYKALITIAEAAITAMGDASTRKDEGGTLTEKAHLTSPDTLIEQISDLEHQQWMEWAAGIIADTSNTIGRERAERWSKYMVPYADLPEEVKEHDRKWAKKVLAVIRPSEISDNKPLSRDEAARICKISIRKNEDGSYQYSHGGMLPFDDIFRCLKAQGWEPKRESASEISDKCEAVQYSDQMLCKRCDLTWDTNDYDPPKCKPKRESGELSNSSTQTLQSIALALEANFDDIPLEKLSKILDFFKPYIKQETGKEIGAKEVYKWLEESIVDSNGNWLSTQILLSIIGRIQQKYKIFEIEDGANNG